MMATAKTTMTMMMILMIEMIMTMKIMISKLLMIIFDSKGFISYDFVTTAGRPGGRPDEQAQRNIEMLGRI